MLTVDRAAICVASPIPRQWLFELNLILLLARLPPIGSLNTHSFTGLYSWTATYRGARLGTRAPNIVEIVAGAVNWTIHNVAELFL